MNPKPVLASLWPPMCALVAALSLCGCGAQFTHVKPGESAYLSLAPKPSIVGGTEPLSAVGAGPASRLAGGRGPVIELHPPLPSRSGAPGPADIFGTGDFAMQTGQDREAIAAFEDLVRRQPQAGDAWTKLAVLYERVGDTKSAIRAFKEAKKCGSGVEPKLPSPTLALP